MELTQRSQLRDERPDGSCNHPTPGSQEVASYVHLYEPFPHLLGERRSSSPKAADWVHER